MFCHASGYCDPQKIGWCHLRMDTKWKILSDSKANYGISQADMYQMYAYQKKYGSEYITLLYPKTEKVLYNETIEFQSKDGVIVKVVFVDMFDLNGSIHAFTDNFQMSERIMD